MAHIGQRVKFAQPLGGSRHARHCGQVQLQIADPGPWLLEGRFKGV